MSDKLVVKSIHLDGKVDTKFEEVFARSVIAVEWSADSWVRSQQLIAVAAMAEVLAANEIILVDAPFNVHAEVLLTKGMNNWMVGQSFSGAYTTHSLYDLSDWIDEEFGDRAKALVWRRYVRREMKRRGEVVL